MGFRESADADLIEELEMRGYVVYDEDSVEYGSDFIKELDSLYLDYMLIGGKFFDCRLREFFNKNLNKTLLTNKD